MAYITEFKIECLAGREGTVGMKLEPHVNIFFGINGSGKTSLLRILSAALRNSVEGLAHVPFKRASVSMHSITFGRAYTRTLSNPNYREATAAGESQAGDSERTMSAASPEDTPWAWETSPRDARLGGMTQLYLGTSRLYSNAYLSPAIRTHIISGRGAPTEEMLDEGFADSLKQTYIGYTNTLLTTIRQVQERGLAAILARVLAPPKRGRPPKPAEAALLYERVRSFLARHKLQRAIGSQEEFLRRYSKGGVLKSVAADINGIEEDIERATLPRTRLQEVLKKLFAGGKSIQLGDAGLSVTLAGNRTLSLAALSSGEKQALNILIQTLRMTDGVVLVDEPELSLHVDWQRQLVGAMRSLNPTNQLVMATHSPDLMADLPDEVIHKLA